MQKQISKCTKCANFIKETNKKGWRIYKCTKCDTKEWLGGIPENEMLIMCCNQFKKKEN